MHEVSSGISFNFDVLQQLIRQSLLAERLLATLSGFFGALAVVLAMIGLYGVMSYTVAQRTGEIGIRMALGARRSDVTVMILLNAARLLTAGLAVGAALSLAAGSAASALLFGLKPRDPATLAMSIALLAVMALAASYLPARRAAALDPIASLKEE
jgi:ABC-type antimicrobial peptide transport system permease subunit